MLKKIFTLFVLIMMPHLVWTQHAWAQEEWAQEKWVGDIPVQENLTVQPELSFHFDAPSGRITVFYAYTNAHDEKINRFYKNMLPSLGWQQNGKTYQKGQEKLEIKKLKTKNGLWRFALTPLID